MTPVETMRELVAAMRANMLSAGADACSMTWGPMTIHVTADAARAVTPIGLVELGAEGGFEKLTDHVEIRT